jgi:Ca-activated chloride channel family protein
MSGLSFEYPVLLAAAAFFVLLAVWGISSQRRDRQRALSKFGDESVLAASSSLPSARQRVLEPLLRVAAIVCCLVAWARPQLGNRPASVAHTGRDLLVLLDLSRSMNAVDDSLSRLAIAKRAISRVLQAVPEDRSGLVVFGGSAFLQLPLTDNHSAFERFLDAASTDDIGDPGTDLSSALITAATTFEHDGEQGYQSILLVSDGESVSGDIGPALARLKKAHIPVFSLGVGSTEGAPVPADSSEAPEKWHRDHIGRVVISRLEEGDLRRAALETGGNYFRVSSDGAQRISTALASLGTRRLSSREATERIDRFQWPLALALLALVLAPVTTTTRRRKQR